ncbi:hypothetical protein KW783_01675 [Candidatus Parcubacteria bacterium]|nr:hypothetical protein [Candidatus Parcubacteria bacterium]
MSWSSKRKAISITVLLAIIAIGSAVFLSVFLYKPPSCKDLKQNQNETGVDCGGVCGTLCDSEILQPIVMWTRPFKVADNVYSALAYIENPNPTISASNAHYVFKLYDQKNTVVKTIEGNTFIPVHKVFAVFEGNFISGRPTWQKTTAVEPNVSIQHGALSNDQSPRIEGTLINQSPSTIKRIETVVILYDTQENAQAVSRTFTDNVAKEETVPIIFTWPKPFVTPISKIEMITRVIP